MFFIRNFKLGAKLATGFGLILAFLVASILFAYMGLSRISGDFAQYSTISGDAVLTGRIQSNLLSSRIAYKSFIETGDQGRYREFEERFSRMEGFIDELKAEGGHEERAQKIDNIVGMTGEYKAGFQKIVALKVKRDEDYGILNRLGPQIEGKLTKLADLAHESGDATAIYACGEIRKHFLLARILANKYLFSNSLQEAGDFRAEFTEMNRWMNNYESILSVKGYGELFDSISGDKNIYFTNFEEIFQVEEERKTVTKSVDDLVTRISDLSEEIKLSAIEAEKAYGPKVKSSSDTALWQMLIVSLVALAASILITITIIKSVVAPVKTVTKTFKDISEGEADLEARLKVKSNDELGHMAKYFNRFMEKLQVIMTEHKNQTWVKTGQAELNEKIRGERGHEVLADNIIAYVTKYLSAQIGAIYVKNGENSFKFSGGYAYETRENLQKEIKTGEGLVGQAALEKRIILVADVPENYIKISSATGEAAPRHIAVVPCICNGEVNCILELGSFHKFQDLHLDFLGQIGDSIAASIHMTESRLKMRELLEKTLEQAEELQVQQEELRQSNEELEEQTKILRESEGRLQSQQEELRQSNEELEEQTRALKESESRLQVQQEELRIINEELAERTKKLELQKKEIELKNDNLRNAQREIEEKASALEAASQYKSEFLANMSHELRTPLNSILVLSQMLAGRQGNGPLSEKEIEFAKTIYSSGTDLLKLINDILDLSKVEAGRLDVVEEHVSLKALTDYVDRAFRPIAEEKGLNLEISMQEGLPESIVSDSQRIQQIVNNLMGNAFKFTHSGGVSMEIGHAAMELTGDEGAGLQKFIGISVVDTGIGIPADKQAVIFEAFKQSDGTTSRKYGGTGLGLSISRELSRLLGGKIFLKSEINAGSTFTLVLPEKIQDAYAFDQAAAAEEKVEEAGSLEGQPAAGNMTPDTYEGDPEQIAPEMEPQDNLILIIEDEPGFSRVLSDLAREKGFECITVQDGETGIAMAGKYQPGAILLDIGLPGISGWEVVERLKKDPRTSRIPVHVISGGESNRAFEAEKGIVGYLKKPVSLKELSETFKKIENAINRPFKKMLVLDGDRRHSIDISEMVGDKDIKVYTAETAGEAYKLLKGGGFDCLILDVKLRDMSGFDFLARLREEHFPRLPVIVHTDKSLTQEEEAELQKYAESIIIKSSRSLDRLVAEASLFLHDINAKCYDKKSKAIRSIHEKENALKGKKVLVVDDDMRNVFALSSLLEEKGVKIIAGRNGREGIQKLAQNPDVDLVLMDVMMPEMDGYTAMREIRAKEDYARLPIIALTAKAMKDDRQKCIEAGANDYLTKPIDVEKLITLLRVWLYK